MMNILINYTTSAMTYGFLRGVTRSVNLKTSDGVTDALPGSKICGVLTSVICAPSFLPIFLYNDVNRAYISMYGLDPNKFGYSSVDTSVLNILFE